MRRQNVPISCTGPYVAPRRSELNQHKTGANPVTPRFKEAAFLLPDVVVAVDYCRRSIDSDLTRNVSTINLYDIFLRFACVVALAHVRH